MLEAKFSDDPLLVAVGTWKIETVSFRELGFLINSPIQNLDW